MKTVKCRTTLGHSLKAKGAEDQELPDLFKSYPKNSGYFCTTHFLSKAFQSDQLLLKWLQKALAIIFLNRK